MTEPGTWPSRDLYSDDEAERLPDSIVLVMIALDNAILDTPDTDRLRLIEEVGRWLEWAVGPGPDAMIAGAQP